jgi:hypothetical protein
MFDTIYTKTQKRKIILEKKKKKKKQEFGAFL